jgi:hypothetical protein
MTQDMKYPKFNPNMRGQFRNGLYCALKVIASGTKGLHTKLFKFENAKSPVELILGSVWGQRYLAEKMCLDTMIFALRNAPQHGKLLFTYAKSIEQIKQSYGLLANKHMNKLINDEERDIIKERFKDKMVDYHFPKIKITNIQMILDIQDDILDVQKNMRKYRSLCESVVSQRGRVVFAKKRRRRKTNISIQELISEIEAR